MLNAATTPPQPMLPRGLQGRLFGAVMERINRLAYEHAAERIEMPPDGAFLDIGFGTGRLMEMIGERHGGAFLAGVDPSRLMVETAKRRLDRRHLPRDLRQGRADTLPWKDGEFDAAAALHCFQFWPDPVATLHEIHRVLTPQGSFVLILRQHDSRDRDWLPNPWSRSAGEADEAERLLTRTGFTARREEMQAGRSIIFTAQKRMAVRHET